MIHEKNVWQQARNVFFKFIIITTIFGQLPLILNLSSSLKKAIVFTGIKIPFIDRMMQYSNFIYSCFFGGYSTVELNTDGIYRYVSDPVSSINILGLILLFVCIVGFVINHKAVFARICMAWLAFSFILLCVIGWGTSENGLVLYSLYFAWAFLSLLFMLIEKLPKRFSSIKYILYTAQIVFLAIVNIPAMSQIIQFGIMYYPAVR
jgi:hypothetical protein